MGFRLVDHTADLAIEATADSAGACLAEAALALTSVLTGAPQPHLLGRPEKELTFAVEAPDQSALVVAFLSELVWLADSEDSLWVGGGVELQEAGDGTWRAQAHGNAVAYRPARHGRGVEVKAVTYHALEFKRERDGWRLRVLLDI